MACETAGGSGVGPAVMRYCFRKGSAIGALGYEHDRNPHERANRLRVVELTLEIIPKLLVGEDQHQQGGPEERREDGQAQRNDADDEAGLGEARVLGGLAVIDLVLSLAG